MIQEEYEHDAMVDSLRCSREEPTEYDPPQPGGKMAALFAVGLMRISAGAKAVATALIWHANSRSGRCDPGMGRLAHETSLSRRAVIKAIKELWARGVLTRKLRDGASNAYQLNWRGLAQTFHHFETVIVPTVPRCTKVHQGSELMYTQVVNGSAPKPMKRTHEGNPLPERVPQPSAEGTDVDSFLEGLSEKGIQRETVGSPSTNTNHPAEPKVPKTLKVIGGRDVYTLLNVDAEETAAAEAAVEKELSSHPLYVALLGWPDLEFHLSDASVMERREKGSGAKLILARFAEKKATGT